MNISIPNVSIEKKNKTFKDYIFTNKCRITSWLCGFISLYFECSEYDWETKTIWIFSYGTLAVIIPIIAAGLLQAGHCVLEKKQELDIENLRKAAEDFYTIQGEIPTIIQNYVTAIYENLNLSHEDRITLYLPGDKDFFPCARYSRNPSTTAIKRSSYPKGRGVIQKVWDVGWWFDNSFPSPSKRKTYRSYHKDKYNLTFTEVKKLSMQALLYCGIRISDISGREPIAILIIESTNSNSCEENDIKNKLAKELDKLVPLLENAIIRSCIPNQSIIEAEEGF